MNKVVLVLRRIKIKEDSGAIGWLVYEICTGWLVGLLGSLECESKRSTNAALSAAVVVGQGMVLDASQCIVEGATLNHGRVV